MKSAKMAYPEFVASMSRLRACFASRVADGDLWKANIRRYNEQLSNYEAAVLGPVLERAWQGRKFFPSLDELDGDCRAEAKKLAPMQPRRELGAAFPNTPASKEARAKAAAYIELALAETEIPDVEISAKEAQARAAAYAAQAAADDRKASVA